MSNSTKIIRLLRRAKRLAKEYYALTGRPLGVTGEVGEYEAAFHLKLRLADVRQEGYDAVRSDAKRLRRFQIKTRRILPGANPSQRVGEIKLAKTWDSVLLVLLDENFDATEIFQAERGPIEVALRAPGSKARNERGALAVSKFKSIGRCVWSRE